MGTNIDAPVAATFIKGEFQKIFTKIENATGLNATYKFLKDNNPQLLRNILDFPQESTPIIDNIHGALFLGKTGTLTSNVI